MIPARNCQPRPAPVAPNYSPQPPPSFLQRDLVPRKLGPELTQTKSLGGAVRHAEASRPGAPNAIRGLACPPSLPASCCWWFITLLGGYFFFFFFIYLGLNGITAAPWGLQELLGPSKVPGAVCLLGRFPYLSGGLGAFAICMLGFPIKCVLFLSQSILRIPQTVIACHWSSGLSFVCLTGIKQLSAP